MPGSVPAVGTLHLRADPDTKESVHLQGGRYANNQFNTMERELGDTCKRYLEAGRT